MPAVREISFFFGKTFSTKDRYQPFRVEYGERRELLPGEDPETERQKLRQDVIARVAGEIEAWIKSGQ